MISIETYFGGSHWQTLPAPGPLYLSLQFARFWRLRAPSASLAVRLPDFTASSWVWTPGVPHFLIYNDGGVNAFDVATFSGTVLYSVPIGEAVEVNLRNNAQSMPVSTPSDWSWDCRKRLKMS